MRVYVYLTFESRPYVKRHTTMSVENGTLYYEPGT